MSTPASIPIQVASVTDRGLSEKRPLNEDSMLADAERSIFAVADGVGGAEAGEVASQTAVEVLSEAFRHRFGDGEDIEDLMELAIQRANSSIHRMAKEQAHFAMMATTIVALHIDGDRATIGHVGDSRLYRITPDGKLHRETTDHSIVEEEVRAGRMTPEQAANHPSKNVISRALGAEDSVEVDMKTLEIQNGTTFLLCSDGITRHIPDNELRNLLVTSENLEATCAELKRRCYERGAEDNLTAVIVQAGKPAYDAAVVGEEDTISNARLAPTRPLNPPAAPTTRIAAAAPAPAAFEPVVPQTVIRKKGSPVLKFFVFLLFLGVAAGAFYGGMRYQTMRTATVAPVVDPTTAPENIRTAAREAVDKDPQKWLNENVPIELAKEGITKTADAKDPEFLYLYGRALMLTGKHRDAMQAFDQAINHLTAESKAKLPLDVELRVASASAALKSKPRAPSQESLMAEQKAMRALDELLNIKGEGGR